jgi:MraZ protein
MPEAQQNGILFTDEYENNVDEKRRVQVPSAWRSGASETDFLLLLWPVGPQKKICLMVLPPAAANKLTEKITAMSFGSDDAESLRRYLGRNSHVVTSDKAGRITLPERMARAAGIEKKVLLVGMFDRFQMWSPELFEPVAEGDSAQGPAAMKQLI